jgi:hypothetical protein
MKNNNGVILDPREIGRRFGQLRETLENGLASAMAQIMPNETPSVVPKVRVAEQIEINLFPNPTPTAKLAGTIKSLARRQRRQGSQPESVGWIEHSIPNGDKD